MLTITTIKLIAETNNSIMLAQDDWPLDFVFLFILLSLLLYLLVNWIWMFRLFCKIVGYPYFYD